MIRKFRVSLLFGALALAQQFENSAANRAAVKEMLDSTLISDEPETLVDEETCDSPGRHNPVLRLRVCLGQSPGAPVRQMRTHEAAGR